MLLLAHTVCDKALCQETEAKKNVDLGRDPRAFKTAEQMHQTATTIPFDAIAAQLVCAVSAALEGGQPIENQSVWAFLVGLNPYRKTEDVQSVVPKWIEATVNRMGTNPENPSPKSASDSFAEGNRLYRADLDKAADAYRKVLGITARHLDARNNLGLASMHMGNDLIAQLELEVCRRLYPDYVPAAVNLTVVYERLGQFEKARTLASETRAKEEDLASASYNAAWYLNVEGKYQEAMDRLDLLAGMDSTSKVKHQELRQLNTRQFWATAPRYRTGLVAGRLGLRESTWAHVVGVVVFLVSMLILVFFAVLVTSGSSNKGCTTSFAHAVLGSIWYMVVWGVPLGAGWWFLMAATIFLTSSLAAGLADSR